MKLICPQCGFMGDRTDFGLEAVIGFYRCHHCNNKFLDESKDIRPPLFIVDELPQIKRRDNFGPWLEKHTEYFRARLDAMNGREVIIQKGTSVGWTTSMNAVKWYVRARCVACGSRLGFCFKQCLHPLCDNYMQVQKIPVDSF